MIVCSTWICNHIRPGDTSEYIVKSQYYVWICQLPTGNFVQNLVEQRDNSDLSLTELGRVVIVCSTWICNHIRPCGTSQNTEKSQYYVWICQYPTEKVGQQLVEKRDNSVLSLTELGRVVIVCSTWICNHIRPCGTSQNTEKSQYYVWICQYPTEKVGQQLVEKRDNSVLSSTELGRVVIVCSTWIWNHFSVLRHFWIHENQRI